MSEPVVQRRAVPDPQEALREQIAQALDGQSVGVYKSGMVQRTDIFTEDARRLADAVLPVVQAHTQALRAERNLVESLRSVEFVRHREQYDRVLAWALRDQQRAGKAEDDLTALRDAVSRLADELQKDAAHARKRQRDPADALALNRFLGDERTDLHAARRLRSLLGDKEAQQ